MKNPVLMTLNSEAPLMETADMQMTDMMIQKMIRTGNRRICAAL